MLPETCQHHPMQWLGEGIILGPILMLSGNSDIYVYIFQFLFYCNKFCSRAFSAMAKILDLQKQFKSIVVDLHEII